MSLPKPRIPPPPAAAPPVPNLAPPEQRIGSETPSNAAALRKAKGKASLRIPRTGASNAPKPGVNVPT